jgi:hypothetical protein
VQLAFPHAVSGASFTASPRPPHPRTPRPTPHVPSPVRRAARDVQGAADTRRACAEVGRIPSSLSSEELLGIFRPGVGGRRRPEVSCERPEAENAQGLLGYVVIALPKRNPSESWVRPACGLALAVQPWSPPGSPPRPAGIRERAGPSGMRSRSALATQPQRVRVRPACRPALTMQPWSPPGSSQRSAGNGARRAFWDA